MNISWNINTTVITNRYQAVDSSNKTLHQQMAREFYVAGYMTMMLSNFDPNPENLLGYAYYPQSMNFPFAKPAWYTILNLPSAVTPEGTTMPHEVGHMLGSYTKCDMYQYHFETNFLFCFTSLFLK